MALRHEPTRVSWWSRYSQKLGLPPTEVGALVLAAARTPGRYPHVQVRVANGAIEAYVIGTGLPVWEVAWLERIYGGDTDAVAVHLGIESALVEEALEYARAHSAEIGAAVLTAESISVNTLLETLPGATVIQVTADTDRDSSL